MRRRGRPGLFGTVGRTVVRPKPGVDEQGVECRDRAAALAPGGGELGRVAQLAVGTSEDEIASFAMPDSAAGGLSISYSAALCARNAVRWLPESPG